MAKQRVLVIDDDPRYLELLQFTLEAEDFDVGTAQSGAAAMTLAVAQHFDVIVTDVSMPDMDGYTLTAGLKADPRTADIPVVFVTARGMETDRRTGQNVGGAEYLTKPFSLSELVRRLRNICQTHPETR
jgi:DNA-binding response OmpR family regulator